MALRRGFKADADWLAENVRQKLLLLPADPLCPWRLAKCLDHSVVDLSHFAATHSGEVACLRACTGAEGFSAVTIYRGGLRLVVLNDGHGPTRRAADLAHELAHALLHHRPLPLNDGAGVRCFDADAEEEAKWLGPALLVPRAAALHIARRQMPLEEAAAAYGCSVDLMRMRVHATGASKQIAASR